MMTVGQDSIVMPGFPVKGANRMGDPLQQSGITCVCIEDDISMPSLPNLQYQTYRRRQRCRLCSEHFTRCLRNLTDCPLKVKGVKAVRDIESVHAATVLLHTGLYSPRADLGL